MDDSPAAPAGPPSGASDAASGGSGTAGSPGATGGAGAAEVALQATVRELEQHVAGGGWDGPVRLFALVRTAGALARDPGLAQRLPPEVVQAADADGDHLTAVEQEGLPEAASLEELLGGIAWPATVDGAAVAVERIVVPPEAEEGLPADPETAHARLATDPRRRDVRLVAAVLRNGSRACAIRARDHDAPDRVVTGPDLVPGLLQVLAATLEPVQA